MNPAPSAGKLAAKGDFVKPRNVTAANSMQLPELSV
jgi:hypothetical protein